MYIASNKVAIELTPEEWMRLAHAWRKHWSLNKTSEVDKSVNDKMRAITEVAMVDDVLEELVGMLVDITLDQHGVREVKVGKLPTHRDEGEALVKRIAVAHTKQGLVSKEAPEKCDLCNGPIGEEFVDGRTRTQSWANMCMPCHHLHGIGLGVGRGAHYKVEKGN